MFFPVAVSHSSFCLSRRSLHREFNSWLWCCSINIVAPMGGVPHKAAEVSVLSNKGMASQIRFCKPLYSDSRTSSGIICPLEHLKNFLSCSYVRQKKQSEGQNYPPFRESGENVCINVYSFFIKLLNSVD